MNLRKLAMFLTALMVALTGCATERLDVKVTDDEGRPVTNAILRVSFSTGNVQELKRLFVHECGSSYAA